MACVARTLLIVLVCSGLARAETPCGEGRGQTGLALTATAGGLTIAAVDDDSASAASGIRAGDELAQVNDVVPRSCTEYARAVRDARRAHKALLVLMRRDGTDLPLVLAAATWDRAVAAAPPSPPAEPPSVRTIVEKPRPAPLPPEVDVSVAEVRSGLEGLAATSERPGTLVAYRDDVTRIEREVETLAVRGATPSDVVAGLRTVFSYYAAAEVAWADAEAERERERRPRRLPLADGTTAPYFSDSEAAGVIDRFPFLRAAVVRDPNPGVLSIESAGRWRPLEARTLLWEHGHEELSRLSTWLASGTN